MCGMRQDIRHGLARYWFFQLAILALVSLIFLAARGAAHACSALAAGLVFMLPNMLFARDVFKHQGAQRAKKIVNSFYRAEGFKLVLSAALFVLVFANIRVKAAAFFITYIVLLASQWLAHIFLVKRR